MLEAITWNTYFSTLAVGIAAYYITILVAFYPQEFRSLLSGRINKISQPHQQKEEQDHRS
tara:strand:+ start:25022 stop:25201 length:180 start_codon:yes stop_codon:yes gene_type:complete